MVNTYNGPLISPMNNKISKRNNRLEDYVKFRLVKSNSCDSRLELTGRVVDERVRGNWDKNSDLRYFWNFLLIVNSSFQNKLNFV